MEERRIAGVTAVRIGRGLLGGVVDGVDGPMAVAFQPGAAETAARVVAAARSAGIAVFDRALPDGEDVKRLGVIEELASWLASAGLKRDGVIVGVGGGALTDAVGFLASIYMRGVEVRYVPTTLLGAVDAAIGGKTAVNVGGKNLLGTFRHPERVVIDIDVLTALSEPLLREGLSEALKAGLVGDPTLVALMERDGLGVDLEEVVDRAVAVKVEIVEADFEETGRRAHLNLGHTVGHAIEVLTGWRHGEAVAVGMVAAARISEVVAGFGEADRVAAALGRLGLPTIAPEVDEVAALDLIRMDKKSDRGGLRMVLLEEIGRPTVSRIDAATLASGLEAVGIGGT